MPKTVATTRVRQKYPHGLTSAQLVEECNGHLPRAVKLCTLRRYVQMGLVNRAVRSRGKAEGRKGHGSVGLYSPESVEQMVAAWRSLHRVPIGTSRADALVLCQVRSSRARAIIAAKALADCATRQAKRMSDKALGRRLAAAAGASAAAAVRALKSAC